ncbi:MAG: PhzF family phenazine biosynthesis protein, partial [Chthonomonadales bacterium]
MPTPFYLVDAFASQPFHGNPACVCLFVDDKSDAWKQSLAAEMNQAETAFVLRDGNGYAIRWFTPTTEVDLCGHATIASVHALHEHGLLPERGRTTFSSKSGPLPVWSENGLYWMDFPKTIAAESAEVPENLLEGLGLDSYQWVGRSIFDILVEVDSAATLKSLAPDFYHLST